MFYHHPRIIQFQFDCLRAQVSARWVTLLGWDTRSLTYGRIGKPRKSKWRQRQSKGSALFSSGCSPTLPHHGPSHAAPPVSSRWARQVNNRFPRTRGSFPFSYSHYIHEYWHAAHGFGFALYFCSNLGRVNLYVIHIISLPDQVTSCLNE